MVRYDHVLKSDPANLQLFGRTDLNGSVGIFDASSAE
jgi:hypothetical protein